MGVVHRLPKNIAVQPISRLMVTAAAAAVAAIDVIMVAATQARYRNISQGRCQLTEQA